LGSFWLLDPNFYPDISYFAVTPGYAFSRFEGCGEPSYPKLLMRFITDVLLIGRAPGDKPAPGDSGGRS
jgi:hypothetical protein